ncbi:putative ABC transport system substrate-binding protein [Bradyrhizobium sp. Gha]|nr:putative ABC transport system substrate-binding protein [Bradyrhizobium sp. Gha]
MRRRDFLGFLGATAASRSRWLHAQSSAPPVICLLNGRSSENSGALADEFRRGLRQVGFVDGTDVLVEYHWLDGHYDKISSIIGDAVRRGVAVIATPGSTPSALAAKAATQTIPIVFGVSEHPVTLGLVKSIARPGTNATGINFFASEIDSKRLGLMHELLPNATYFAVLTNPTNLTTADATAKALREVAPGLGLELIFFKASTPAEIEDAFAAIGGSGAQALFIAPDAFFTSHGTQFGMLAERYRLPASTFSSEMAAAGLLIGYGTNLGDMFRQVGVYAGTILRGTKPAELPVLQSTKFEFTINLKTARLLGVDVSPAMLARADEVIE